MPGTEAPVRRLRSASYDEYIAWYLARESHKAGNQPHVSPVPADRLERMQAYHEGKILPWFPSARWSIVMLPRSEFERLIYLYDDWVLRAGLIFPEQGLNYRLLRRVAENAIAGQYLQMPHDKKLRHLNYYQRFQTGKLVLRNQDRIVIRTPSEREIAEDPAGGFALHDGNGRALPYMVLLREGKAVYTEVEAFLAEKPE